MDDKRFIRQPGTARNYVDTLTGETISYRQMQKRSGRPTFEAIAEANRAAAEYKNHMARYNALVSQFRSVKAEQLGIRPSEIRVRGFTDTSLELKKIIRTLKTKDTSAQGLKAQALVSLGMRSPEWIFAVGETPTEGS